jgi:ATP-binding cassette, subfamily B (MDR/TAP), member 1
MIITCIVGPVALGFQFFIFHYLGSNIVNSIRFEVYNKMVRLPMTWFDDPDNHPEQISVKLGADIYMINHIISRYFSHLCVAISSVTFGLLLAFIFEWRTALISIVLIPLIGLSGVIQAKMLQGYLNETRKLNE